MEHVHIVAFSPCGGTFRVAKLLARDLPVIEHDWTLPASRSERLRFASDALVFLAFPVYGGRMPRNIREVFANLEGDSTACAMIAVYGNRAYEGALLDLHAAATARGFRPIAAVAAVAEHSMAPTVAAGRPNASDAARLAGFGQQIVARAKSGGCLVKAPGAMPAWKVPAGASLFPVTDASVCAACGQCAAVCPAGAISEADPSRTNTQRCIVCAACVKYCPQQARQMGSPASREHFKPHLEAAAAARREPELFL